MHALDRQLDRASRDVPVAAHVQGPARRPTRVSGHQTATAPHDTSTPTGAATYGCECSHSRHLHRSGQCRADGCACFAYRRAQSTNTRSAPALSPQPGA